MTTLGWVAVSFAYAFVGGIVGTNVYKYERTRDENRMLAIVSGALAGMTWGVWVPLSAVGIGLAWGAEFCLDIVSRNRKLRAENNDLRKQLADLDSRLEHYEGSRHRELPSCLSNNPSATLVKIEDARNRSGNE